MEKLSVWLDLWLNKFMKNIIKQRTYDKYLYVINKQINPVLGKYNLNELSPFILQDFVTEKLKKGNLKTGQGLSVSSIVGIMNVLKESLRYARDLGLCDNISAEKVKMPKPMEKMVTAFNREDEEKIVEYCLNSSRNNHIGVVICLYTGIRIGELLALTWDDIDFDKMLLSVNKTAYKVKINGQNKIMTYPPKTRSSVRVIPIADKLCNILKEMKEKARSNYVISTKFNERVETRAYQKTYQCILNKIGVEYKNFHCLRHTFATRAIEIGMDVKTLSEILGHANSEITLSRYVHSMIEYKVEMINKMEKIFNFGNLHKVIL